MESVRKNTCCSCGESPPSRDPPPESCDRFESWCLSFESNKGLEFSSLEPWCFSFFGDRGDPSLELWCLSLPPGEPGKSSFEDWCLSLWNNRGESSLEDWCLSFEPRTGEPSRDLKRTNQGYQIEKKTVQNFEILFLTHKPLDYTLFLALIVRTEFYSNSWINCEDKLHSISWTVCPLFLRLCF